ncbi:MAG: methionine synthase [Myxococcales bacterium]|nr:methionine synthase [Myxococcales bacterium]
MKRSEGRFLTTHVGSLPRTRELSDLLIAREAKQPYDEAAYRRLSAEGIRHVLEQQIASGMSVVNDGEQSRVGFQTYVPERMSGFGGVTERMLFKDFVTYPDWLDIFQKRQMATSKVFDAPAVTEEIEYIGFEDARLEYDLFDQCAKDFEGRFEERFMTAASPGIVATTCQNAGAYDTYEGYVRAIAREMKKEYDLIHERGYLLQLDCPDLAMERGGLFQNLSYAEFLEMVALHVDAINHAVADIPADRIRLHVCWGNYDGPHDWDPPMADLLPILYDAKVGGLSLELANPRHQHEYAAIKANPLPDSMVLLPGVLDSTTNYIEHPQICCNRILEAVDSMGDPTRVLPSTDCGFGTFAGWEMVGANVTWAKFRTLREGADLAAERVFG